MKEIFDNENDGYEVTKRHFQSSIQFPFYLVLVLLGVHIYLDSENIAPENYGILTRDIHGLKGIITAPWVHGGYKHLVSNIFPLFILCFMSMYFYKKVSVRAFWMIYFFTGLAVWLFARPNSNHIGVSGIVYGLVAFIFWNGIFRRSFRSIIISSIVLLLYSGMFLGILPKQEGVSWESHLFGSLVGIFAAYWFKDELEDDEKEKRNDPFEDERGVEKNYFLARDTFEKTKSARREEELKDEMQNQNTDNEKDVMQSYWNQNRTWQ